MSQALGEASEHIPESELLKILEGGDTLARQSLIALWASGDGLSRATWQKLHQVSKAWPEGQREALVRKLGDLAADTTRFGLKNVERIIHGLDAINLPKQLSDDALEGLAVFFRHAKGETRLQRVWQELGVHLADDAAKVAKLENLL